MHEVGMHAVVCALSLLNFLNAGRSLPKSGKIRSKPRNFCRILVDLGRKRAETVRIRSDSGQQCPQRGTHPTGLGQLDLDRPNLAQVRPELARNWPNIDQAWPGIDYVALGRIPQKRLGLGQHGPTLARSRQIVRASNIGPKWAKFGPNLTYVGPTLANLDQHWLGHDCI